MVFNIDPDKPIVILSHPRSGSTWIQDSLPQFNLSELFTMYCGIKSVDIHNGIRYSYLSDPANDLDYRFKLFNMFQKHHIAISVKVHLHLLTDQICDFFESKDLQYVLLKRKNDIDTFWSLLIALNTLEFHNTVSTTDIIVSRQSFIDAIQIMNKCENRIDQVKKRFKPIEIIYEDMIQVSPSAIWNPSSNYIVQNAKEKVNIINIEEINGWLNQLDKYSYVFR